MRVAVLLSAWAVVIGGCVESDYDPAPLPTATSTLSNEPAAEDESEEKRAKAEPAAETKETVFKSKDSGISFTVPAGWKKVEVKGNIPEGEYALPRTEGDEHDGRLTLMGSGGGLEQNITRWQGEFNGADEPKIEKIKIDGVEATLVDIRGEWKGTSFRPISPPRPEHRLVAVFVPMKGRNDFYIKLTGPKATLAKWDEDVQKFLKSGSIVSEAKP